ncbi:hypothetical protein L6164_029658 [Bauhinia variegata]|uniref:Uncharacterized protein n=1 Tax=Bauhinia variegata TaxID=167791 RepID=A0ACB9LAB8_BAUVA|nr:hypothetical protein L6164_029658 [Bauhinia variegata]
MVFGRPHQKAEPEKVSQSRDGVYLFPPKGLNIVWGNDPRYWMIPQNGPAWLMQVSWLEVSGSVRVTKGRKYRVKFEVSLDADSFGFKGTTLLIMAKVGKNGAYNYDEVTLAQAGKLTIPNKTSGLEVQIPSDASDPTLYFGLYEVWSGKWKGGLEIHKALVQPA